MLTRPIAAVLLVTCIPQLIGCTVHTTQRVTPTEAHVAWPGRVATSIWTISGATTRDGRQVQFDTLSARLDGDSLRGTVKGQPYVVGLGRVILVRVTRGSQTTTMSPAELSALLASQGNERIYGVTTLDGRDVTFDPRAAYSIANDTLRAVTDAGKPFQAATRDIQRVWVKRVDLGLSAMATIGGAAAVMGVLLLVALAAKESCPFVYSWDGSQYVFDAEPYGGATTRGLERDDWAALEHLRPVDGEYRLMVTNEVNETQYTNAMELLVVDHPAGVRVMPDARGGLHTLAAVRPPTAARDHGGRDILPWLARTDRLIWEPSAVPDSAGGLRQEVTLTFPKPAGASTAKLVANVATGLWGSHMIRSMLELWGRDVDTWYAGLDTRQSARDSLLAWNLREEIYTLKVWVEEPTGWQVRGVLEGGGPFIAEDRVVPLDVSRVVGDSVRIRVRPPVGFWALNSFAVDYGRDEALRVDTVPLASARDSARSVRAELAAADTSYYVMPDKGDHAWLTFRAPAERPGLERTVLLHSRGWYRLHLDATGPADTATLRRITEEPGAVARLAAERFGQWQLARQARP